MKRFWLACAVLRVLLTCAAGAAAQEPAPDPGGVLRPLADLDLQRNAHPFAPVVDLDARWSVDFLAGLPTGVRLQRDLFTAGPSTLQAEGFLGLEVIFPTAGAGLRYRFAPFRGADDSLAIAPGIDVYGVLNPFDGHDSARGAGFVAADVDVVWRHTHGDRWNGEVGIKAGAGDVFSRHDAVIPVVSAFAGVRF